jgi:predicted esterase
MAKPEDTIIDIELPGFKAHGIFKKGKEEARKNKPLVVLIHGGGTNATYFENEFHSLVLPHGKGASH